MIDTSYPQIGEPEYDALLSQLVDMPFNSIIATLRAMDWHQAGIQKALRDLLRWHNRVNIDDAKSTAVGMRKVAGALLAAAQHIDPLPSTKPTSTSTPDQLT